MIGRRWQAEGTAWERPRAEEHASLDTWAFTETMLGLGTGPEAGRLPGTV